MATNIPRPEYPRPDFARNDWASLNGEWEFSFDKPSFDKKITVPFCYQSKASGIGDVADHNIVWYKKKFSVDMDKAKRGRVILNFGAVDYLAKVWVNNKYIGEHVGGHVSFAMDISEAVEAENVIEIYVEDYANTDKPRGKQSWKSEPFACWYTPTTGIWQSVWVEYVADSYLKRVKITPNVEKLQATCELFLSSFEETEVEVKPSIEKNGEIIGVGKITSICKNGYGKAIIPFDDLDLLRHELLWTPENPNLIDIDIVVLNKGEADDKVSTYFGLRSVGWHNQSLTLNNDFYYQRLILDQGYWTESLLTPPSDEAIIEDIKLTKAMGFNGARKHQKIEDPRYYYWADKLGLLVWGEMPSAYMFNDTAIKATTNEMIEFIERDYNHPSIVAWVPVNESWGVRNIQVDKQQQSYANALLYTAKAIDPIRFVSVNDGWEQTDATDICAIHDYALFPSTIGKYNDFEKVFSGCVVDRAIYAEGHSHKAQPVVMTEYGGISFSKDDGAGWGYHESVSDENDFLARLEPITTFLIKSRKFAGYCYTQLTDVMQEVNGLLNEDRTPKIAIEKLEKVFGRAIDD